MTAPTSPPPTETSAGFVALIGAPNSGKSTLLNALVGAKVSIVSRKVQTTRARVLGIAIEGGAQLVFVDTPGIFAPRKRLDRAMVAAAWSGAADADVVLAMFDAKSGLDEGSGRIIERLKNQKRKAIAVINKIDLIRKPGLLELAAALDGHGVFERIFMISATGGEGVDDLLDHLVTTVPSGPWHYPEDQLTDLPNRLLAAEVTREKLYLQLHQEIPYAISVETEKWDERPDGSVRVDQVVYVERPGQRGIVLGQGGKRIKAIGEAARKDLEDLFERRMHLFVFVKVRPRWSEDATLYADWGLDYNASS
jgi:GTP-binding protein Era